MEFGRFQLPALSLLLLVVTGVDGRSDSSLRDDSDVLTGEFFVASRDEQNLIA